VRTGRRRKDNKGLLPIVREPNGQKARPTTVEQIQAAAREREQREKMVVLSQPHRRGSTSQLAESHLGRFCEANHLRRELYDSGLEYGAMVRRWVKAKGGPLPDNIEGNGSGIPDSETVNRWEQRIIEMESAIVRAGGHKRAIYSLCVIEEKPSLFVSKDYIIKGLLALAIECGRLDIRDNAR
jgi:hypothetical protein